MRGSQQEFVEMFLHRFLSSDFYNYHLVRFLTLNFEFEEGGNIKWERLGFTWSFVIRELDKQEKEQRSIGHINQRLN